MSRLSRRAFLAGAAGGAGALALAPLARTAHSGPVRAPLRLLLVHRPTGTIPARYACAGGERDFALSPILEPFADLREHMVIVDGLAVRKAANTPGEDHGNCIVTFMTGGVTYRPEGSHLPLAERISIDQTFARDPRFSGGVPVRSLQLTADDRALQFFMRVTSYAGRGAPLPPVQDPLTAFARVFGTLGDRALDPADLARLRAGKQSVLDFTRADAERLRGRLPAEGRERLERHLGAIREVEQIVQRVAGCLDPAPLGARLRALDAARKDELHAELGRAHLDIVRAAFQCDLTRVASFMWGSMETNLSRLLPGTHDLAYHPMSHYTGSPVIDDDLARIHRWYNEQLAAYLRTLRDTPDLDGRSLLHNTLVVSWSEMASGAHTYDNVPIQLFGGAGGRLAGGRLLRYPGHSTNDLWLAIAAALGRPMTVFGDAERCTGPLPGLFDDGGLPPVASPDTHAPVP